MSLDFEHGVLFRAVTGEWELFDCPLSRRSARDVAQLLARRWNAAVEVIPCGDDGAEGNGGASDRILPEHALHRAPRRTWRLSARLPRRPA